MKVNIGNFLKIILFLNIFVQAEAHSMILGDEDVGSPGHKLSAKVCDVIQYQTFAQQYEELHSLSTVAYTPFPRDDHSRYEALKRSKVLKVSESLLG